MLGFIILPIIRLLRIPEEFYLYKDKDKDKDAQNSLHAVTILGTLTRCVVD